LPVNNAGLAYQTHPAGLSEGSRFFAKNEKIAPLLKDHDEGVRFVTKLVQRERIMKSWYIRYINPIATLLIPSVVAIGLLTGCATMEGSWSKAQRYDSIKSYKRFTKSYPDSPHISEAMSRIENLRIPGTVYLLTASKQVYGL